ncbi:B12-binding domain-containing radical SAM protein [Chloroflexota bacterium]
MDILLINSPVKRRNRHAGLAPPLGLLYIASVLHKAGYGVRVIDLNIIAGTETDQLQALIGQSHPKIVGISTLTETYPTALKIAQITKQLNPAVYVVMGGAHPSVMPNEVLSAETVDAVVKGEGEYGMLDLADCLIRGKGVLADISGIAYKVGKDIRTNAERDFIINPDELPLPARRLLPLDKYECPATILASRGGCPYGCRYCAVNNIWKGKRRFRQPERVVDEMLQILRDGVSSEIIFVDDIFTLNSRYVLELCKVMKNTGQRLITWRCTTRADLIDEDLLEEMHEAGCTGITYGVEAGSQKILEVMDKRLTLDQVRTAVISALDKGMRVTCAFMFPHPEDTEETVREQISFMKMLTDLGAEISLSFTTPLPGTDYYEHADELGIKILADKWDDFDMSHLLISNRYLSQEKLAELELEIFRDVGLDRY